jgi:hypothetical protein
MENPSKYFKNSSARITFEGISHIMMILRPSFPRSSPCARSASITRRASSTVRTKGTMTSTFRRPISSLTRRIARHSRAKHSAKASET